MQEVAVFHWDEDHLRSHEAVVASGSTKGLASEQQPSPPRHGGGSFPLSSTTCLLWRTSGPTLDFALVSLEDARATTQRRFRFASDLLGAHAFGTSSHLLLAACTTGELVLLLQPQLAGPVVPRRVLSQPGTTACCFTSTATSLTCWTGLATGAVASTRLGLDGELQGAALVVDLPRGGLRAWLPAALLSPHALQVTSLTPSRGREPECVVACFASGFARLLRGEGGAASALVQVCPETATVRACAEVDVEEAGRRSFVFFAEEPVLVRWDPASLLGVLGTYEPGMAVRPGLEDDPPPPASFKREYRGWAEACRAVALEATPSQLAGVLRACPELKEQEEWSSTQSRAFSEHLVLAWRRDRPILDVSPWTEVVARGTAPYSLVRVGGLSLVLLEGAEHSPTWTHVVHELPAFIPGLDYTSVDTLRDAALPPRVADSALLRSFAEELVALAPVAPMPEQGVKLSPVLVSSLLLGYYIARIDECEHVAQWAVQTAKLALTQALLRRAHELRLSLSVLRSTALPRGRMDRVSLHRDLFLSDDDGESVLPGTPNECWASSLTFPLASSWPAWAELAARRLSLAELSTPHSLTWWLLQRPSEAEALVAVSCLQVRPARFGLLLQALASLYVQEGERAKEGFVRAAPMSPQRASVYFQAVAAAFRDVPETALFFLTLAMRDSTDAQVRHAAFETSLRLPLPWESVRLLHAEPEFQVAWVARLVLSLLERRQFDLLLQLPFATRGLLLCARDVLLDVVQQEVEFPLFLAVYAFLLRHDLVEFAARVAYLYAARARETEQELDALLLCLAACERLPRRCFYLQLALLSGGAQELVFHSQVEKLCVLVQARRRQHELARAGPEASPWELYTEMLGLVPGGGGTNPAWVSSLVRLALVFRFPLEPVLLALPAREARRVALELYETSPSHCVHLSLGLAKHRVLSGERLEEAWFDLFRRWRCVQLWLTWLSDAGFWLEATERAADCVQEMVAHEVCFGLIDRLVCRAERFAFRSEEAARVKDVQTKADVADLARAATELKRKTRVWVLAAVGNAGN